MASQAKGRQLPSVPFLFHFSEQLCPNIHTGFSRAKMGTKTVTEVGRESTDDDCRTQSGLAIPRKRISASSVFLLHFQERCSGSGQMAHTQALTKTLVEREHPDSPIDESYSALASGTKTATRVAIEQQDDDFARTLLGTETLTAVSAEGRDDDPGSISQRALPR